MAENLPKVSLRTPYEPPTVTRVFVDPHQELLQQTGCGHTSGSTQPSCDPNQGGSSFQ